MVQKNHFLPKFNRGRAKRFLISLMASVLLIVFSYGGILAANAAAIKNYKYGATYQKQGKYDASIKYYSAAVKADKNLWQAWLGMGICYYKMKKNNNAALMFKYVLTIKPNEPTATKYLQLVTPKQKEVSKPGEKTVRSKAELMWRSAVFPGLGQFYNGETVKGYMYTLGFMASVAAIIKFTIDQNRAVDEYYSTNYDFDTYYKKAEDRTNMVWIPVGTAAAIWSISVLDAFLSGSDENTNIRIKAWMDEGGSMTATTGLEYKF